MSRAQDGALRSGPLPEPEPRRHSLGGVRIKAHSGFRMLELDFAEVDDVPHGPEGRPADPP